MSKSRGNKTSKTQRAARRAQALALMKEGKSQAAIVRELKISRMTFWRDLQALESSFVSGSADDVREFKQKQLAALMRIEEATAKGTIDPNVANALTRIRDSVARLLGLDAPTKSVSIRAKATVGAHRVLPHLHGLTEIQIDEICRIADSMERAPLQLPPGPPKLLEAAQEER